MRIAHVLSSRAPNEVNRAARENKLREVTATVAKDSADERGANNKTKEERANRRVKPTSETQQESESEGEQVRE